MFESGLGRADKLSRRAMIRTAGIAAGSLATASTFNLFPASAQEKASTELPNFTGPGTNPHWNSVGPIVSEPQKVPLILLTDRPIQLETPRNYFSSAFTPNDAFYVRWHLDRIPNAVDMKSGSLQVQLQGLEQGEGPEGMGSRSFMKSLDLDNPVIDECVVAYAMNGEPLPMLNGFPVRLVVPGYFATYWMKCLTWIRVLDKADENFWMKTAYRIPDTPRGTTTPEAVKAGGGKTGPISRMPVRSFLVLPDGSEKIPAGMSVNLRGTAFSGYGRVTKGDTSDDDLKTWKPAQLGEDFGG